MVRMCQGIYLHTFDPVASGPPFREPREKQRQVACKYGTHSFVSPFCRFLYPTSSSGLQSSNILHLHRYRWSRTVIGNSKQRTKFFIRVSLKCKFVSASFSLSIRFFSFFFLHRRQDGAKIGNRKTPVSTC